MKIPGPDHPITITPTGGRVVVTVGGRVIADSHKALTLKESTYPAVHYIPRADVDMALLARSGRLQALGFAPEEMIARLDRRFRGA